MTTVVKKIVDVLTCSTPEPIIIISTVQSKNEVITLPPPASDFYQTSNIEYEFTEEMFYENEFEGSFC